jgi:hypothetical protein
VILEMLVLGLLGASQEPIREFTLRRNEINPATDRDEIIAVIKGAEAIPISQVKGKEVFNLKDVSVRYFTEPKKPGERSEEIQIRADHAHLDNGSGRVDLAGRVRVDRLANGSRLETPEAVLLFNKAFVCTHHEAVRGREPGRCPSCERSLRSKTYTTLEAPKEFTYTLPTGIIRGEGLWANDDHRHLKISRKANLDFAGELDSLTQESSSAPAPPSPIHTVLTSEGPMTVDESEETQRPADGRLTRVRAKDQVRYQRRETKNPGSEERTVQADEIDLFAQRQGGPEGKADPQKLTATGHVTLDARSVGRGPEQITHMKSETLLWQKQDEESESADLTGSAASPVSLGLPQQETTITSQTLAWKRTERINERATLRGTPEHRVVVVSGKNTIVADSVTIQNPEGLSTFQGHVVATFVPGRDPGARPLTLRSARLHTQSGQDGREIEWLEAFEEVTVGGLLEKEGQPSGEAKADRFYWNQEHNWGVLDGRPLVRVTQEQGLIQAPRMVLEGRSLVVLKGPKQIRLVQKEAERQVTYFVTAEGDVELITSPDQTRMRARDRCFVQTDELRLYSDRLDVAFSEKTKELESLHAQGRVRLRELKEGAWMYGDRLDQDPKTKILTLSGRPFARAEASRQVSTQDRIRVFEKVDPATGQRVPYTEFVGGHQGVRIILDQGPK